MRFYRVSYSTEGGNSGGYSWHTSRREAEQARNKAIADDPTEYDIYSVKQRDEMIDVITIAPTKAGILDALQRHASEPTNG